MMAALSVIIATFIIALIEVPPLIRQKLRKDLLVFIGLLFLSFLFGMLQALKIPIPNPFDWITIIFNPMTNIIQSILDQLKWGM